MACWPSSFNSSPPAVPEAEMAAIVEEARRAEVPVTAIGTAGGDELKLDGQHAISLAELRATNEQWLPQFMAR